MHSVDIAEENCVACLDKHEKKGDLTESERGETKSRAPSYDATFTRESYYDGPHVSFRCTGEDKKENRQTVPAWRYDVSHYASCISLPVTMHWIAYSCRYRHL